MPDIFISYRREDSSGHAGRLFDGIRDRFGDESVFMDVTDIRPGDDFVTALDAALALCGVVLVVIGPQWLMCTDASGRRRLDDPGDHLRIEIAHALHGKARVIPVLVRGARMPAEHELPDDLKALVRRQAQEISDSRWSFDAHQLIRTVETALGTTTRTDRAPATVAAAFPRGGWLRIAAPVAVLFFLIALTSYLKWFGPARQDANVSAPESTLNDPIRRRSDSRNATDPPARVPPGGEARAGDVVFKVLGGLVTREVDVNAVRLYVRATNVGARYGINIWSDSFRLVAGDETIVPEDAPTELLPMQSSMDLWVTFKVPASAAAVQLQVGDVGKQTSKVPLDLRSAGSAVADEPAPRWRPSTEIQTTLQKRVGPVVFDIEGLRLEHVADGVPPLQPEELTLTIRVRLKNVGAQYGYLVSGDEFRLIVDDVPLAPKKSPVELVKYQASLTSEIVFVIPGTALKVALQMGNLDAEPIQVPLDLSPARQLDPRALVKCGRRTCSPFCICDADHRAVLRPRSVPVLGRPDDHAERS